MRKFASLLAMGVALAGCSTTEEPGIDYKSAGSLPTLETPPDLVLPAGDNRFSVPNSGNKATSYSAYSAERAGHVVTQNSTDVLPKVDKARIERSGSERWLVVQAKPEDVWPVVKDFWQSLGFIINVEHPEAGVMETDWAENRAKIPMDGIRSLLGKVIDGAYSTDERDKFRTRLEPTADGKGTEIYISHRGMYEVFEGTVGQTGTAGDQGKGRTVWQPRQPDPSLEAEMLRRLMVRFGVEEAQAKSMLAVQEVSQAKLVSATDGAPGIFVSEPFDRTWRRVGLALDRVGFLVEDRDRVQGVYFVRYADADAKVKGDGFLSRLAFWESKDDPNKAKKYRVSVVSSGEGSQIGVYMEDGKPATNETGQRIAKLLLEQLK